MKISRMGLELALLGTLSVGAAGAIVPNSFTAFCTVIDVYTQPSEVFKENFVNEVHNDCSESLFYKKLFLGDFGKELVSVWYLNRD